jgi:hypothetical protein
MGQPQQARLLSLINFAQASAKLKASPVSDASKHHFCEYEHNLQGLLGVHFNAGGEDVNSSNKCIPGFASSRARH